VEAQASIAAHARLARERLRATMFPYWLEASRDEVHGGFLLHDDVLRSPVRRVGRVLVRGRRPRPSDNKHLVTQARLVWVFAHAHHHGYDDGSTYLDAAAQGRRFLLDHFLDRERGGYRWETDRAGAPVNDVKLLYGQAFVVYAFVELARATGERAPLDDALDLFRAVERELHDDRHGAWREQADADWGTVAPDDPRVEVQFRSPKSSNAIIHWLETLSELLAETGDDEVRHSLHEALDVTRTHLFPADPGSVREWCLADWSPDPTREQRASYGHDVEFAWLMLRAQDVLGEERDWDRFHAYLDHTLRLGFDDRRGAAFTAGFGDQPATFRYKLWWVQCELIVALCVALEQSYDERYAQALARTLDFVERCMTDRRDGILLDTVQEDGRRRWPRKSGQWKAGYHDVRAAVKLAETF
jgi:mannose/cellobiose epimerase-like protein (N-acyl-D-glucosamine 2-epimerase family)